jgi:glycosyltransferase involved in cell wall biosynthesis
MKSMPPLESRPNNESREANQGILVSVIIPVYNRCDLLPRTLNSALGQTHKSLEILVVDDGSEEDVGAVVDAFSDDRLKYIRSDVNKGISEARNNGIKNSKGRYVAFLDSDDEWFDKKIEMQLSDLRKKGPEYGASYCKTEFFDDEESAVVRYSEFEREGNLLRDLTMRNPITSLSSVMVERRMLEKVGGFNGKMNCLEDWELWIRLARVTLYAYLGDVMVRYHIHSKGRMSENIPATISSLVTLRDTHEDLFKATPVGRSSFLYHIGYCEAMRGQKWKATLLFLGSIAMYPLRKDAYVSMVLNLKNGRDWKERESVINPRQSS